MSEATKVLLSGQQLGTIIRALDAHARALLADHAHVTAGLGDSLLAARLASQLRHGTLVCRDRAAGRGLFDSAAGGRGWSPLAGSTLHSGCCGEPPVVSVRLHIEPDASMTRSG